MIPRRFEELSESVVQRVTDALAAPDQPQRVGPYHILGHLGGGGMGEIYKAERRSPMRQVVAIKVIKLGMDSKEILARFDSERQALARMDHPHIAKVLDAGSTDSGRPYFVMEYVAGQPITKFADDNKLSIKDRLLLFTQACQAISHAHTKAIINRDIKASNVLAYMHDGQPCVKVIHFGIAKALTGDRLTGRTFNTDRGHVVGTYETMSPEQADGSPDIDTRTDVYSLGVLLYELLTGAKPFDHDTLAKAADEEIRRIIREVEPPRPSTRLSALGESATRIATLRRAHLDALAKELRTELEWIPLKAIRKERDRRYSSAEQICGDIQNYLDHRPLLAGPESRSYRLRKYLKRHEGAVVAVTVVVLAIVLGTLGTAAGFIRAERNKRQLIATLSELVAKTNESALSQLGRGELPEAEEQLRDAAARASRELGSDDRITLRVMHNLAAVLQKQGNLSDAESRYKEVLQRRRRVLGDQDRETLISMNSLGAVLRDERKFAEAEELLRLALSGRQAHLSDDSPDTMMSMYDLGALYQAQGKLAQAEPLFREAVERRRRVLGEDDANTLGSIYTLARLLQQTQRNSEAEPLYRELFQKADHAPPRDAAVYIARYGTCLAELGRYLDAEPVLKDGYDRLKKAGREGHPAMREVAASLAQVYATINRPDEAAHWRAELANLQAATQRSSGPTTAPAVSSTTQPA